MLVAAKLPDLRARPVPIVGDPSSATERAHRPVGVELREEKRLALYEIIGARRGYAGCSARSTSSPAPSGYWPPPIPRRLSGIRSRGGSSWSSAGRKRAVSPNVSGIARPTTHECAEDLDLQLEGIREAPLGIVVCCDRRARAAGRARPGHLRTPTCGRAVRDREPLARGPRRGSRAGRGGLFRPDEPAHWASSWCRDARLVLSGVAGRAASGPGLERAGWSRRARSGTCCASAGTSARGRPQFRT